MCLLILLGAAVFLPGVVLSRTCKEYDVVEYLNITKLGPLMTMTRPRKDWTQPLDVSVDSIFIAIQSLVEKTQTMTTYFWLYVGWKNDFISWKPEDFCNISHVTLPLSYFWVPDLYFHEQVVEDTSPWIMYVDVTSDGLINAAKPMHLTSTCILDIHYFPFDVQKCSTTLTSFMYLESSLTLRMLKTTSEILDQSRNLFMDTGEWRLLDLLVTEGSAHGFSKITFQAVMKRKSSIFVFSLIVPTLFLLLLDLLSYFIPKSYNEKANFKLTVLLGISVLAIILNDYLPASTNTAPVIVTFFVGTMLLLIMGIVEIIFVMYIGGKIHKEEMTPSRKFPFCRGLFLKSCLRGVRSAEEDLVRGVRSAEEDLVRDARSAEVDMTRGVRSAEEDLVRGVRSVDLVRDARSAEEDLVRGVRSAEEDLVRGVRSTDLARGVWSAEEDLARGVWSAEEDLARGVRSAEEDLVRGVRSAEEDLEERDLVDRDLVDGDLVDGDLAASVLEKILEDVQLIKAHVLSLQKKENLEEERQEAQERMETWLYSAHLALVAVFFTSIIIRWTT